VVCVGFTIGGAFRLARFNLLPTKTSFNDSVGLTIPMAGATVTLSVLVNYTHSDQLLPGAFFPVLLVLLGVLMVSRIRYPELGTVVRVRWLAGGWLLVLIGLAIWLSPQLAGLALVFPYVGFGPLRSAYRLAR
jgi:CDP-diacylglycerol--serine O-phosphatidyltransferase